MKNIRKNKAPKITLWTAIVVVLFLLFQLGWYVYLLRLSSGITQEGNIYNEWHYSMIIEDNIKSLYWEHSEKLLNVENEIIKHGFEARYLDSLTALPGVIDAFYVDKPNMKAYSAFNNIPEDSLLHCYKFNNEMGCRIQYAKRQIGGLIRFWIIDGKTVFYRVIGMGEKYIMPERIIGLVLNENWLIEKLPALLDSLGKNNPSLSLFGPYLTDSLRNLQDDPFASPGGWKRSAGVLHDGDTLWWTGDRDLKMNRTTNVDFGLSIQANHTKPDHYDMIEGGMKRFTIALAAYNFIGLALLFFLFKTIRLHRTQARRNRIALAHFAHAIKTPAARLRLGSDLLRDEQVASPEEEKNLIQSISGECDRLELSVKNAAMAIEQGKLKPDKQPGDLVKLVTETLDSWENTFKQYEIQFRRKLPDNAIEARFDGEMIRILIDNLVDNALRHTYLNKSNLDENSAVVQVELGKAEDYVRIAVDDSGKGVPKKERTQIFEGLKRDKPEALTGVSGLGLGLIIVSQIAKAHEGKVFIEDSDLSGAKFIVEIAV